MAAAMVSAEDDLSCPICFEIFVDPYTPKNLSPCGHVCCEVCLKHMVAEKCLQICPECRQKIKIPVGGIVSFTTNYRLRSLAENHQKGQSQMCHEKAVGVPFCTDHNTETLYYYCVTCNSLACQICLTLKHNGTGHNIEGIKELCSKQKKEIKAAIARAKSRITETENVLTEYTTNEIQISELHGIVERQMNDYIHDIELRVNELLDKAEDLKRQLESSKQFHELRLKQQMSSVETQINSMKISYKAAKSATKNLPDHEYITQHIGLVNKMEDIRKSKPFAANKTKQDVIKFVIPNSLKIKLGHFITVAPDKVRTIKQIQTLDGFIFSYKVNCSSKSSDGLVAIVDVDGNKVVIYHKINGKYEQKLHLKLAPGNRSKPYGVAICPDGRFMVARSTCIEVYSPDGNHQNTSSIEITGTGNVNVHCVKVTSGGRILVGDYTQSLIVELSPIYEVIRTICTSIKPYHMTLIHDTHFAISDAGKVVVIDIESGQELLSIDIALVQGICCDEQTECLLTTRSEPYYGTGNIDVNTGVIEQYSYTTGKLIACLQKELCNPQGMALTSDGHLIVANRKTVEIYEIQ